MADASIGRDFGAAHVAADIVTSPNGYSLTPPPGWSADQSGKVPGNDLTLFTKPDGDFEIKFGVRIGKASRGMTLPRIRQAINKTYPLHFSHWKGISQSSSTLGGMQDLETTAICFLGSPARQVRLHQVLVIKNGRLYFFTAGFPEEDHAQYDKTFVDILHSVRWKP